MKSPFARIFSQGDPAIVAWGHAVVAEAFSQGVVPFDPQSRQDLDDAIDLPDRFDAAGKGKFLHELMMHSMRAVPRKNQAASRVRRTHQGAPLPSLEEVARTAGQFMTSRRQSEAVSAIQEFGLHPLFMGAGLLLAAYRQRLGSEAPLLREVFEPVMREIALYGEGRKPLVPYLNYEGIARPLLDHIGSLLEQAGRGQQRLVLEFGSGNVPVGMLLADGRPEDLVLAIEPETSGLDWTRLGRSAPPENWVWLQGWAEWTAAYALSPFAAAALIVCPTEITIWPTMLSALLAVKKGGSLDIFQIAQEKSPVPFLQHAGLAFYESVLPADDPRSPRTRYTEGQEMRHLEIEVPQLGDGAGEGPWFAADAALSGGIGLASGIENVVAGAAMPALPRVRF